MHTGTAVTSICLSFDKHNNFRCSAYKSNCVHLSCITGLLLQIFSASRDLIWTVKLDLLWCKDSHESELIWCSSVMTDKIMLFVGHYQSQYRS